MSETALLGCSWASCRQPATTRAGEWDFCATHAAQDPDDPEPEEVEDGFLPPEAHGHGTNARARQHYRDREPLCPPCAAAATRYQQDKGKPMTTPANPPGLLERASAHENAKVVRLGQKIESLLDDLRGLMKASEAQEQARDEIRRLETELAEAKARLKGGSVTPIHAARAPSARSYEPLECRKGCGKTSAGASGRAGHERHCHYGEATG